MKYLVLILILCIMLSITGVSVSAEEESQSGIAIKLGYFMPSNDDVNDIYGGGLIFAADYLYVFQGTSYGISAGIERFHRAKTTLILGFSVDQSWLVIPVTGTFLYFPTPDRNLYIGAGLGYYSVKETLEMLWIPLSESESALGFHLVGGYTIHNFFGEAKISYAVVDDVNAGGLSMLIGYRLKI